MVALLILLLILPASIIFLFLKYKRRVRNSPSPPGPAGLPLIGNLHQLDTAAPHVYLRKLAEKYGALMSMKLGSVPLLVVSSPEMAKAVMKTHDLAFCSRPKALGQHKLSYNGLDVAFAPYSESWRELRKICVIHLLSNKQVQSFRPIREDQVSRMIRDLSVSAAGGGVVNLSTIMLTLTSTLICRMAFGKRSDEGDSRRLRFDELMIESQAMQGGLFVSDYLPLFGWVDKLSGMISRLDRICRELDEFYQELIDEHLDPTYSINPTNPNILDLLIHLKQQDSAITWDHVKAILMDIFVAGTDTAAATIIWSMTALIQNPEAMEKLQKEMRQVVGDRGEVKEDDLPKLPYLKAVIKETLRLYPPAPLLLPRESMESCNVEGYVIPAKTLVYINAWAIARDPEYWESPDEFVAERFLDDDSSIDITGQDFRVIPFGAGRRGCPGISMGLATVELLLANLLHSFHWEMPPGMSNQDIDTHVLPGITMHKKHPLCLVPTNRIPT